MTTPLDKIKSAIIGVPPVVGKKPDKVGVVQAFAEMQVQLEAAQSGALVKATRAALTALTSAPFAGSMAWVTNDPVPALNGIYENTGSASAPAWTRRTDIPQFFISGINAGAGTANAIQVTTDLPVPAADARCLIGIPIVATNTASPVTLAINGGVPIQIKTLTGNNIPIGGLVAGMVVIGVRTAGTFRLFTDQTSSAIQTASEAAQVAAEAAQLAAETAKTAAELAALEASAKPEINSVTATNNAGACSTIKLTDGRWLLALGENSANAPVKVYVMNLDGKSKTLLQTVTGNGTNLFGRVNDVKFHRTLDDKIIMVVGDYRNTADTLFEANSVVFKFDSTLNSGNGAFAFLQNIATRGCRRVTTQRIDTTDWLLLGSEASTVFNDGGTAGITSFRQRMHVYTWNSTSQLFDLYQEKTNLNGTRKGRILKAGTDFYLIPSAYYDDGGTASSTPGNLCNLKIFKYQDSTNKFVDWKTIETEGCTFIHSFMYAGRAFFFTGTEIAGEYFDRNSKIFEITNSGDLKFVCYVPTRGCTGADSVFHNGMLILATVNAVSGHNLETTFDSSGADFWRFDGMSVRKLSMGFETHALYDINFFVEAGNLYCATAESYSQASGSSAVDSRIINFGKLKPLTSIASTPRLIPSGSNVATGVLERLSNTQIVFRRFGGDQVWFHGQFHQIPRAGIIGTNAGLTANTLYAVFVVDGPDGQPVLELNTRTPYLMPATGIYVDDQFVYKTYVGDVFTDGSVNFIDTETNRNVFSFFNAKRKSLVSVFDAISAFNGAPYSVVDSTKELSFVTGGVNSVSVNFTACVSHNVAGGDVYAAIFADGAVTTCKSFIDAPVANYTSNIVNWSNLSFARGRHTLSLRLGQSGGTISGPAGFTQLNAEVTG